MKARFLSSSSWPYRLVSETGFNFVAGLMSHVFFFSNIPGKNFKKISWPGYPRYYEALGWAQEKVSQLPGAVAGQTGRVLPNDPARPCFI
jgi:hypothetical protein